MSQDKAAYDRQYRQDNRERLNAQRAAWRAANPELLAGQRRRNTQAHPERVRANTARWAAANPERVAEINDARNARRRATRVRRPRPVRVPAERERWAVANRRRMHGLTPARYAALIAEQGGRCYLCGLPLDADPADPPSIEHDHRHCPPGRSCDICRRGIAHQRCNSVAGLAGDSPALLRKLARNLAAAEAEVTRRMADEVALFGRADAAG